MAETDDKDPFPSDLADRFQVRMPKGLRERIKVAADANDRSMNAEIVATLSSAYPPSTQASEVLSEIYSYFISTSDKFHKYDKAALFEMFEDLGRKVYHLEKAVNKEEFEGANQRFDAVLKLQDSATGKEKRLILEYKNSITYKDFALQQLKSYLEKNPDFDGGVIIVGDERLKPERPDTKKGEDGASEPAEASKRDLRLDD